MAALDATHDPARRSWVASANDPAGDFPIQNLPLAAFRRAGTREPLRGGVAIGTEVLDLGALNALKPFEGSAAQALEAAAEPHLNALMGQGAAPRSALRAALSEALCTGSALEARLRPLLVP